MNASSDPNRAWAFRLIRALDPGYRHRWEIVDGIVGRLAGPEARWLDGGCGENRAVEEFPCAVNAGIDPAVHPGLRRTKGVHFAAARLERLPFRDGAFTLVTLNTVVEHLADPPAAFREIRRVLTPGGHLLIHTTNRHSPLILAGKLVPSRVRRALFTRFFGASDADVFPALHRANTRAALTGVDGFESVECYAVQDLNRASKWIFLLLFAWHLFTKIPGFGRFRTNLIVLLRKTGS